MKEIEVRIIGVAPIILHNGQTCDPLNKFAKAMKEITKKRNKTEEDILELSRIEWHAGLYVNAEGEVIIPADILDSALIEGAKKSKLGKQFKSAVFVPYDAVLDFSKKKYTIEELWDNESYRDVRGVRVGTSRVMRTRPIFRDWSLTFTIQFDENQVNDGDVMRALKDCGTQVGLCDYRPKYGRFEVEE